ncbi:alpha-1,2-fucosyltransferase [Gramella jeungdoensis]|uniref:Alpha-1,2-fucosyltransferase n=1 Tax=Gramella jeungdoensis TaxID=708091 RepID=A0ABT0Z347_9FLAO|nr:alpha-1,2-fucosyltransferase [Gramella jeungdoensis]MCM8569204.1 alpha-1,2-fucosyltransferase [Gramella jeungdoensis]
MICIKLKGGLGNQMFQYALGRIIEKKEGTDLFIDNRFFRQESKISGLTARSFELDVFPNTYKFADKAKIDLFFSPTILSKIKRKMGINYPRIFMEKKFGYNENVLNFQPPIYLSGYFQSYLYFKGYENLIDEIFSFPSHTLNSINKSYLQEIKAVNSVAVHIRRGDYVQNRLTQEFHGNCNRSYYQKAIEFLKEKIENPHFFFFSDDPKWVRNEFKEFACEKTFIENTSEEAWIDMFLMKTCKHNIIANSSYSWWSAWLNKNSEKLVIAPKKWFAKQNFNISDLIPKGWIQL